MTSLRLQDDGRVTVAGGNSRAVEVVDGRHRIFRVNAAHDVGTLHVVALEVDHHLVTLFELEHRATTLGGQWCGDAYPRSSLAQAVLLQFLAFLLEFLLRLLDLIFSCVDIILEGSLLLLQFLLLFVNLVLLFVNVLIECIGRGTFRDEQFQLFLLGLQIRQLLGGCLVIGLQLHDLDIDFRNVGYYGSLTGFQFGLLGLLLFQQCQVVGLLIFEPFYLGLLGVKLFLQFFLIGGCAVVSVLVSIMIRPRHNTPGLFQTALDAQPSRRYPLKFVNLNIQLRNLRFQFVRLAVKEFQFLAGVVIVLLQLHVPGLPREDDAHTPLLLRVVVSHNESALRTRLAESAGRMYWREGILALCVNGRNGIEDQRLQTRIKRFLRIVAHIVIVAIVSLPSLGSRKLYLHHDIDLAILAEAYTVAQMDIRPIGAHVAAHHLFFLGHLEFLDVGMVAHILCRQRQYVPKWN